MYDQTSDVRKVGKRIQIKHQKWPKTNRLKRNTLSVLNDLLLFITFFYSTSNTINYHGLVTEVRRNLSHYGTTK